LSKTRIRAGGEIPHRLQRFAHHQVSPSLSAHLPISTLPFTAKSSHFQSTSTPNLLSFFARSLAPNMIRLSFAHIRPFCCFTPFFLRSFRPASVFSSYSAYPRDTTSYQILPPRTPPPPLILSLPRFLQGAAAWGEERSALPLCGQGDDVAVICQAQGGGGGGKDIERAREAREGRGGDTDSCVAIRRGSVLRVCLSIPF
jgi:hypothetical protein